MKIKTIILALFSVLVLLSCSEKDGDWDPMKWEKTNYTSTKIEGKKYIQVPKQGSIYTFTCKNYNAFWLSGINITTSGYGFTIEKNYIDGTMIKWDSHHVNTDGCTIDIEGNTMTVKFDYTDAMKTFRIEVTAGDIFESFYFVQ